MATTKQAAPAKKSAGFQGVFKAKQYQGGNF